jgi:DUF3071 family protein
MRPVRFVALSEDGQAFVLTDEVGRLLTLPIDERVSSALRIDRPVAGARAAVVEPSSLSPRDIQARIRSGESADEVARVAGVPVDRVLRYAGPVLQERAMLAQHARRTKLKTSQKGASLAEVVDARLSQHGIDADKISWDAYRRDDGTWRIVATWPSGKATAQAIWQLDKARQLVIPHDDMAQYLCAEQPTQILGQDVPSRGGPSRSEPPHIERGGHEPMRPAADTARRESRPAGRGFGGEGLRDEGLRDEPLHADPIRAGRDALLASLDRPLGAPASPTSPTSPSRPTGPVSPSSPVSAPPAPAAAVADTRPARGAAALIGKPTASDEDSAAEMPSVPSLAVLRPRHKIGPAEGAPGAGDKPRKRLPSWDDVLFGSAPARESS